MATTFAEERIRLTYDDYAKLPNDGKRYEIVEGELIMSPAPQTKHERVQMNWFRLLDPFIRRHKLGELFVAPQDVVLEEHTVVQPDLFFVGRKRAHIVTEKSIQGPPDLVIEIESPFDEHAEWVKKLRAYDKYGVPELWRVRPDPCVVDVYRRVRGDRMQVERPRGTGKFTSPLFPRLTISLKKIWV
jgi:Uma2 family endonuclease